MYFQAEKIYFVCIRYKAIIFNSLYKSIRKNVSTLRLKWAKNHIQFTNIQIYIFDKHEK